MAEIELLQVQESFFSSIAIAIAIAIAIFFFVFFVFVFLLHDPHRTREIVPRHGQDLEVRELLQPPPADPPA
jgi:hypothetical protein